MTTIALICTLLIAVLAIGAVIEAVVIRRAKRRDDTYL